MARKKVNLQWISNDSSRRVTYKKRCKSLMKKTSELTTLCGIKACVVVYGEGETQPEVWPSVPEAKNFLKKFKDMPDIGRFKKIQSQDEFIHGRICKLRSQVSKLDLVNREHETSRLLHESMDGLRPGLTNTTIDKITSLNQMVDMKIAKVKELLQQHFVRQGVLPNHPVSSSSQPQASSHTYTQMQSLAAGSEEILPLQQGWPTDLAPVANGGGLGDVVCSAFGSSSNSCAGPSRYGDDMNMTQTYNNLACSSGFSWEQDVFPTME